jgi:hypothetical protein
VDAAPARVRARLRWEDPPAIGAARVKRKIPHATDGARIGREVPPTMGRAQAKPETPPTDRAPATQVAPPAIGRARGRRVAPPLMGRGAVALRDEGQRNGGRSLGSGLPPSPVHEPVHERPVVYLEHPPPQAPWTPVQSSDHGGPIRLPLRSALGPPVESLFDPGEPRPKIEG